MSFKHLSTNQPGLFAELETPTTPPAPRVKSARSANRAAWWEQDLSRTATYLMGQARNDDERAFVERLYDEAMTEGPDFINYRGKSAFLAAPKLGIDRNAYARRQADRGQLPQAPVAVRLRHRSPAHQAHPDAARLQGGAGHQRLHDPGASGARRNRPAHVQAGIRV
jgi:hypothetical protein